MFSYGGRRRRLLKEYRSRRMRETGVLETQPPTVSRRLRRRRSTRISRIQSPLHDYRCNPSRMAAGAGAVLLSLLAIGLWFSDAYRVDAIAVEGNSRLSAREIIAASQLKQQRVFSADTAAAEQRVLTLPDVAAARVTVSLRGGVAISVVETAPALLWHNSHGTWVVDERGRVVDLPPDSRGLVVINDETGIVSRPGDRLPAKILEAGRSYGARYGQLIYRADQGYIVTTAEGWQVRLGIDAAGDARQAAVLDSLREELNQNGAPPVGVVDLRFPSRPYYRLKGQGG